jgi:DNA topoisomerase I
MGLRFSSDARPGISRMRAGKGFRYVSPLGTVVNDPVTLRRIKAMAIPPAWKQVWIATDGQAHIQATGRDARGRKQYRYHARWREVRGQNKFDRLVLFARALNRVRRRVARDLCQPELNKAKVLAVVVRLLEQTLIRVGNEEYARDNRSFGLTTLRDRHVKIRGDEIRFQFIAKSGIRRQMTMSDRRLARLVKRCQDLPGQQLFQYLDEGGRRRSISSSDVNRYLREACGAAFTAKDFRTWAGTVRAAIELSTHRGPLTKKAEIAAIQRVATHLGNTPAVCRSGYIHPTVLTAFTDGSLRRAFASTRRSHPRLSRDEAVVLALLESGRDWRQQLAESARVA